MTTPLGGRPQAFRMMIKNGNATAMKKGTIVTWGSVAAGQPSVTFLDGTRNKDFGTGTTRETEIPIISCTIAGVDSASAGGAGRLGVVAADIPPLGFGEIVCYGPAQVLFGGTVAAGDHFSSNASGLGIDAAATDRNVVGIALEAATANNLSWAFVNCLSFGGHSAAFFGGKAVS